MPDLRDLLIYLHVASVLLFALMHGVSAMVAFRLRATREPAKVAALLEVSRSALNSWLLGIAFFGFVATGVALGFMGGYWGQWWLWISIAIIALVTIGMTPMAAMRLRTLRVAMGVEPVKPGKEQAAPDPAEAQRMLEGWNPFPVAALGAIGLFVVLWLMMFKPF